MPHQQARQRARRRRPEAEGAVAQFTPAEATLAASPKAEPLRRLQAAADASPRLAQLRALKAAATTRPSPVAQRVRFDQTDTFTTTHVEPKYLPPELAKPVEGLYVGETKDLKKQIDKPQGTDTWLTNTHHMAATPEKIWADIRATDWETLGAKKLKALEAESMNLGFFDQQNLLMEELKQKYKDDVQKNAGRPIRIASFQFERDGGDEGPLVAKLTPKTIESAITEFITDSQLLPKDNDLVGKVQANMNQTLFSSGQFQWIAANWDGIKNTHNVVVDVDFYPDRMPGFAGFHKDSVGDTLFVNLTYANKDKGVAPEYIVDRTTDEMAKGHMPQVSKDLVEQVRDDNKTDTGDIQGVDLPERGRVSFIDPAIWHSTPMYERRAQNLKYGDNDDVTLAQAETDMFKDEGKKNRSQERWDNFWTTQVLALTVPEDLAQSWGYDDGNVYTVGEWFDFIDTLDGTAQAELDNKLRSAIANTTFKGSELKAALSDPKFTSAGYIKKRGPTEKGDQFSVPLSKPNGRRLKRARSVYLKQHPGKLVELEKASKEARSFIRTWVMLIKK